MTYECRGELPLGLEQVGGMDVHAQYIQTIADLNRWSPSVQDAASNLIKLGYGSENYPKLIREGEEFDENHTLRAYIAIIKGDERPMGDIYDEIRRANGHEINGTDLNKAQGTAKRLSPFREKSPWFS